MQPDGRKRGRAPLSDVTNGNSEGVTDPGIVSSKELKLQRQIIGRECIYD